MAFIYDNGERGVKIKHIYVITAIILLLFASILLFTKLTTGTGVIACTLNDTAQGFAFSKTIENKQHYIIAQSKTNNTMIKLACTPEQYDYIQAGKTYYIYYSYKIYNTGYGKVTKIDE